MVTKIWLSIFLCLVILSSSIYLLMPEKVRIDIGKTNTRYSVWENESWVLAATEYVNLFDGTKKMRAKTRDLEYWNTSEFAYVRRVSTWKDNITTTQTYKFEILNDDVERFPIENSFGCLNCEGKIVHYEIRDILYNGTTKIISSPFAFGHNMKIEWEDGAYYSKVFKQKTTSDKIIIKYRPKQHYEVYDVRLFDPYYFTDQDWNDDFEDGVINSTFWGTDAQSCVFSGGSASDRAQVIEITAADGFANVHTKSVGVGGASKSYYAVMWTKQDFNDSLFYTMNFTMGKTSTNANTADYIAINNGTDPNPDCSAGTVNRNFNSDILYTLTDATKQNFSITINGTNNNITLYNSTDGSILATQITTQPQYRILWDSYTTGDATSREENLSIYNFTVLSVLEPTVSILFPADNAFYDDNVTELNYSFTINNGVVDTCIYNLNNGTNVTANCSLNVTGISSIDENNTWIFYVNDSRGQTGSDTVSFYVDKIFPEITFRDIASENNTWINNQTIISDIFVNETFTQNVTFTLFNTTGSVNVTILPMTSQGKNNMFSYVSLPDANYTFNVTVNDSAGNENSTETRLVYLDSTAPAIDYTASSDPTNKSGDFVVKDNIFVNVSVSETYFKNITVILSTSTGIFNQTTPTVEASGTTYIVNFTDLEENMYFWNVTACDLAGNCNTTDQRNYGVQTVNLSLEDQFSNLEVELAGGITVNATYNDGDVFIDIDHPSFGVNYTSGTFEKVFELVIDFFRKTLFSDGSSSFSFNYSGLETKLFNITSHQYDEVVGLQLNISGINDPEDVTFFKSNTTDIDRTFQGRLVGDNIYQNQTSDGATFPQAVNLTFNTNASQIIYMFVDDNASIVNFTINASSLPNGFSLVDNLDNFSNIDTSLTTAHLNPAGVIMLANSSKQYALYDSYDSSISSILWTIFEANPSTSFVTETNDYIQSRILFTGTEGFSGHVASTSTNNTQINLYTSDNIEFNVIGSYDATETGGSCDGHSRVYVENTVIWTSSYREAFDDLHEEESDANVTFLIDKFNKTHWAVNISGTETSFQQEGSCDSSTETMTYDWTNGNFTVLRPSCGAGDLTGSLTNSFFVERTSANPAIKADAVASKAANICDDPDVITRLYPINYSLWNRTNATAISTSLFESSGIIEKATANFFGISADNDSFFFYLSADDGVNWESVTNGVEHTFSNTGTILKWKVDFNTTLPAYKNVTEYINAFNVSIPEGNLSDITFDFGNDGVIDYTISGNFTEDNGTEIVELTTANLSLAFNGTADTGDHAYRVPLVIQSSTIGFLILEHFNLTYNPNPVYLNETAIQSFLDDFGSNYTNFSIPVQSTGGNITFDDLKYDYAGGNDTINITAHNAAGNISVSRNITYFYSRWDYSFVPSLVEWLYFAPKNSTAQNVTPYGQTSSIPIINITNLGYDDRNANLFVLENDSESCVNTFISSNSTKPLSSLWDGLVGYWPFDIDARDLSGNSNNGILFGVSFNETGGQLGGNYEFDGNDYIQTPSSDILNMSNTSFSLSVWFKGNLTNQNYSNPSGSSVTFLWQQDDAPSLSLRDDFQVSVKIDNGPTWKSIDSINLALDEQWNHVVGTFDLDNNNLSIYLNGEFEASASGATYNNSGNVGNSFRIGRDDAGRFFNGSIDEAKIYNKSLSSAEINEMYNRNFNKYYDIKLNQNWTAVNWNLDYLNKTDIYMWADYSCNSSTWTMFEPYFYFRQCCEDCICSEDLV